MTASIIPFDRPIPVRSHSRRRRPEKFYSTCEALVAEIAIEKAMREFAEEFPDECLRDPVFLLTGGLP